VLTLTGRLYHGACIVLALVPLRVGSLVPQAGDVLQFWKETPHHGWQQPGTGVRPEFKAASGCTSEVLWTSSRPPQPVRLNVLVIVVDT